MLEEEFGVEVGQVPGSSQRHIYLGTILSRAQTRTISYATSPRRSTRTQAPSSYAPNSCSCTEKRTSHRHVRLPCQYLPGQSSSAPFNELLLHLSSSLPHFSYLPIASSIGSCSTQLLLSRWLDLRNTHISDSSSAHIKASIPHLFLSPHFSLLPHSSHFLIWPRSRNSHHG